MPTEKDAISGVCHPWYVSVAMGKPDSRFSGRGEKPQVGPKIDTAYPQPEKFFLANVRRLV